MTPETEPATDEQVERASELHEKASPLRNPTEAERVVYIAHLIELHSLLPSLISRIRSEQAERKRLAEIVEKLPKTGDGVPILPGMEVWSATTQTRHVVISIKEGAIFTAKCDCHGEELTCVSSDAQVYENNVMIPLPNSYKVYSTREAAALAASEVKPTTSATET